MNESVAPYQDPATGAWVCPMCREGFVTQINAENCSHLIARLDHERPTEWWSERDEALLRGEILKLQGLPRPAYVERDRDRLVYRQVYLAPPRRTVVAREVGAWVMLLGLIGLLFLIVWAVSDPPTDPPAPAVTPVTFAPAAPTLAVGSWSTP